MHELAEAELEKRGPEAIRALLLNPRAAGPGPGSCVRLGIRSEIEPLRAEVEAWLREKVAEAETLAVQQNSEQLAVGKAGVRWAFWAVILAAVAIVISLFH